MIINSLNRGSLERLENAKFNCKCGMHHTLSVQQFGVVNSGTGAISHYIKKLGGMAHILLEQGAAGVCESEIVSKISQRLRNGISVIGGNDKAFCDRIISEMPKETSVLVAIGGRTACQSAKYIAEALALPLIFVSVLPDDDDLLSPRSLLWHECKLKSFAGKTPEVVIISLNSAVVLSQELIKPAISLLAANMLFCFENLFNAAAIGSVNCDKLDLMIAEAVKSTLINADKANNGKNFLECLMTSLVRVSVAKAMNRQGVYDTSYDALCRFLEAKTGMSRGVAACATFNAVTEIFETVLKNANILSVGDAIDGDNIQERKDGLKFGYSLSNLGANRNVLLDELDAIKTTIPLLKTLVMEDAFLTKDELAPGLADSVKDYRFEGILTFAASSGLI